MGKNKSRQQLRNESIERKTTIIFCGENSIIDIVSVLRAYNNSKLWAKTKYEWSLQEWEEFFSLKKSKYQLNKIKNEQ